MTLRSHRHDALSHAPTRSVHVHGTSSGIRICVNVALIHGQRCTCRAVRPPVVLTIRVVILMVILCLKRCLLMTEKKSYVNAFQ